jgi:hypothetical protein
MPPQRALLQPFDAASHALHARDLTRVVFDRAARGAGAAAPSATFIFNCFDCSISAETLAVGSSSRCTVATACAGVVFSALTSEPSAARCFGTG